MIIKVAMILSKEGVGAIILADGVKPDANAIKRAEENGINIYLSDDPVFDTALKIHKALMFITMI